MKTEPMKTDRGQVYLTTFGPIRTLGKTRLESRKKLVEILQALKISKTKKKEAGNEPARP